MFYFVIVATMVAGIAAFTDWRTGHIPNGLTFGVLAVAPIAHFALGCVLGGWRGGLWELGASLMGALLCALGPGVMYFLGAIGGGDIKLFAAIGALCLYMTGLQIETYAFVAAVLIAPAQLAYKGVLFQTLGRSLNLLLNPFRRKANRKEVPPEMMTWFRLGPAIFLGAATGILAHWGEMP